MLRLGKIEMTVDGLDRHGRWRWCGKLATRPGAMIETPKANTFGWFWADACLLQGRADEAEPNRAVTREE